jgi:competence protein ComGC
MIRNKKGFTLFDLIIAIFIILIFIAIIIPDSPKKSTTQQTQGMTQQKENPADKGNNKNL